MHSKVYCHVHVTADTGKLPTRHSSRSELNCRTSYTAAACHASTTYAHCSATRTTAHAWTASTQYTYQQAFASLDVRHNVALPVGQHSLYVHLWRWDVVAAAPDEHLITAAAAIVVAAVCQCQYLP
eukprot:14841-Heterococcus_DN1.PRE.3